jgi:transcriptional regulator with XRE-family HTH domain
MATVPEEAEGPECLNVSGKTKLSPLDGPAQGSSLGKGTRVEPLLKDIMAIRDNSAEHGDGEGREPHPIDRLVGARLRLRRMQKGLSQSALAHSVGVTFQAVQKYESGDIRISASRLYDISRVLETDIGFFFGDEAGENREEPIEGRRMLQLVRAFQAIRDPQLQADVLRLVSRLAGVTLPPDATSDTQDAA